MPLFSSAGRRVMVTILPLCNPTPEHRTGFLIVVWRINLSVYLLQAQSPSGPRVCDFFSKSKNDAKIYII
jgi:hypothetical protein